MLEAGHTVSERVLIKDDRAQIRETLERLLESEAQVVLTSGGTGIAGRDFTVPIVESLIVKPMPGFANCSGCSPTTKSAARRCCLERWAGSPRAACCFALPGSSNAVKTAWDKLLKKELSHLVFEFQRHG